MGGAKGGNVGRLQQTSQADWADEDILRLSPNPNSFQQFFHSIPSDIVENLADCNVAKIFLDRLLPRPC